jgi:hypothetical protein
MPARRPLEIRFWEKVDVRGPNDCWNWTASKTIEGYGWIGDGNKHMTKAHRVSYAIHFGPIPAGMLVCHHCDNPSCVNPKHLFLGFDKDNNGDKSAKGRCNVPFGEKCHSAKLTPEIVRIIRARVASGETMLSLSREYKVRPFAIQKIVDHKSWKQVV